MDKEIITMIYDVYLKNKNKIINCNYNDKIFRIEYLDENNCRIIFSVNFFSLKKIEISQEMAL